MKSNHLISSFFIVTSAVILITGCSSKPSSADMKFLNNIPSSNTKQIDDTLRKVNFKFQEPTSLPFTVSYAQADLNEAFNNVQHIQLVFVSKDKHAIELEIDKAETLTANIEVRNRQITKLYDGTEAVYGNNGSTSQLIWSKDGVTYSLASNKDENGKGEYDLGMNDLVKIADSFK